MNPTVDNDLQKAIDDITNNTNQDPVFTDPVAAPAADEPVEKSAPAGGPISDFINTPNPTTKPEIPAPTAVPIMDMPPAPAPIAAPDVELPEPPMPPTPMEGKTTMDTISTPDNMQEVKDAALRDLAPILDKLDVDPSKKFELYKSIMSNLHDTSVIAPAYNSAKDIADEKERGEALLYLINSIDNM